MVLKKTIQIGLTLLLTALQVYCAYDSALRKLNNLRLAEIDGESRIGWSPLLLNDSDKAIIGVKTVSEFAANALKDEKINNPKPEEIKILTHKCREPEYSDFEDAAVKSVDMLLEILGIYKPYEYAPQDIAIKGMDGTELKYILGNRLGSGNCVVYEAVCLEGKEKVAIKFDKVPQYLNNEANLLSILDESALVSKLLHYGGVKVDLLNFLDLEMPFKETDTTLTAMVLELEGFSLDKLKGFCGGKLSLHTVLNVLTQQVSAMQQIHTNNIIHKDVKPANLVVNRPDFNKGIVSNTVKLIDFDNSEKLHLDLEKDAEPIERGKSLNHPYDGGSIEFMSISCHNKFKYTRKDEFWSAWYTSMKFSLGSLTWQRLFNLADHDEMKKEKIRCSGNFSGSFGYHGFEGYLEFLQDPNFFTEAKNSGTVDYKDLSTYLEKMKIKYLIAKNESFDWNEGVQMFFDRDVINIEIGTAENDGSCSTVFVGYKFYVNIFSKMNDLRKGFQLLSITSKLNLDATMGAEIKFKLESEQNGNYDWSIPFVETTTTQVSITYKLKNPNLLEVASLKQYAEISNYFYVGFGYYFCAKSRHYYITIIFEQEFLTLGKLKETANKTFVIDNEMTTKANEVTRNYIEGKASLTNNSITLVFPPSDDVQTIQEALLQSAKNLPPVQLALLAKSSNSGIGMSAAYDWTKFQWVVSYVFSE